MTKSEGSSIKKSNKTQKCCFDPSPSPFLPSLFTPENISCTRHITLEGQCTITAPVGEWVLYQTILITLLYTPGGGGGGS